MKAAVLKEYGPPTNVTIEEWPTPEPSAEEVVIKVYATTVSAADWRLRSMDIPAGFRLMAKLFFGVRRPRKPILGTELCGEIVALGSGVSEFKVGDKVVAYTGGALGAHAEFVALKASTAIVPLPDTIPFEQAAALCFGGVTALDFLRTKAGLQAGEKVLVIGASGAVGSAAIQLAKFFGAEVTGVCSGANLAMVQSLGADRVIDYQEQNVLECDQNYDVIMDCVGAVTWSQAKTRLTRNGRLLMVVADLWQTLKAPLVSRKNAQRCVAGVAGELREDVATLVELAARGKFTPFIDSIFPLAKIADAHARVQSRRKRGNVVVRIFKP